MYYSMMDEFIKKYWTYYLEIENQMIETQRYVEFDKRNNNTYSMEFLKLYQMICSEIDGCAKEISACCNSSFKFDRNCSIKNWGYEIQQVFPDIITRQTRFNGDYLIVPWKNWKYVKAISKTGKRIIKLDDKMKTPNWWVKYNKVKHSRMKLNSQDVNYENANLKNTIAALAGLYILEREFIEYLYFTKNDMGHCSIPKSKLFTDDSFKHIEKMR